MKKTISLSYSGRNIILNMDEVKTDNSKFFLINM